MAQIAKPVMLNDGSSPLSVWLELHSAERMWQSTYLRLFDQRAENSEIAARAIASHQQLLSNLSDFPSARWQLICDGQGWTPVGCAAMSWCDSPIGFKEIVAIAELVGWEPKYELGGDFAALLINPSILPPLDFKSIMKAGQTDLGAAILFAARLQSPEPPFEDGETSPVGPKVRRMMSERSLTLSPRIRR